MRIRTRLTLGLPSIDFLEQADRDYYQLIEAERTQVLVVSTGGEDKRWSEAWQRDHVMMEDSICANT